MFTVYVRSLTSTYIIHDSGRREWDAGRVQRFTERATWMRQEGDNLRMSDGFQSVLVIGLDMELN